MAIPTVADVLGDSALLLGDASSPEVFTTAVMTPFYSMAYRELVDLMMRWNLPMAKREAYYNLPAYTSALTPAAASITDMGEPEKLWERGGLTVSYINSILTGTITLANETAFASHDDVTASGIPSPNTGMNGKWIVEKVGSGPAYFSFNGATLPFTAAAGPLLTSYVSKSSESFQELTPVGDLPQLAPGDLLRWWKWEQDTFYFVGATAQRQLKIEYTSSGAAPQTGSVGIDNSRNFLATRAASLAAMSKDMTDRSERLTLLCFGSSKQADGTGGYLRDLVIPMLKEKQKRPMAPLPFRPNRSSLTRNLW